MRSLSIGSIALVMAALAALAACDKPAPTESARPDPNPTAAAPAPTPAPSPAPAPTAEGALHLGAPIEASAQKVALSDVAKNPDAFVGKTFQTSGTVTAVCQHMGCWMEIKDDSGEAHVKMAGHAFFVPKTASGRKARVLATLVKAGDDGACAEDGDKMAIAGEKKAGCRAEAESQLGRPLAKLELVAQGVELL